MGPSNRYKEDRRTLKVHQLIHGIVERRSRFARRYSIKMSVRCRSRSTFDFLTTALLRTAFLPKWPTCPNLSRSVKSAVLKLVRVEHLHTASVEQMGNKVLKSRKLSSMSG
jgi:hypothetical protein